MEKRDKKGRFLPGQRPVGRAKGSTNKVTKEVRDKIQQLVESYSLAQMKIDLMELDPGDRLKIISGLLDFIIPKLNRTDHALQGGRDVIVVQLPALPTQESITTPHSGHHPLAGEENS